MGKKVKQGQTSFLIAVNHLIGVVRLVRSTIPTRERDRERERERERGWGNWEKR